MHPDDPAALTDLQHQCVRVDECVRPGVQRRVRNDACLLVEFVGHQGDL
jgi:hypothetical protein